MDIIGGSHIRCFIGDHLAGNNAKTIKGMAFKAIDTPLGNALLNAKGKKIQLAVRIKLNRWQGRESAELMIEDMAV